VKRQVGRLRNKDRLCMIAIVGDSGEYSLLSVSKGLVSAQDSPGRYWLSEFQNGSGSNMSHVQNDGFRACNSRFRYCELLRCCVALASILVIVRSFSFAEGP
jgi:hypothetical protein